MESTARLLLLSGPMGSGKTSVAQLLVARFGFTGINSGAFLRSKLELNREPIARKSLQDLGDQLDIETDYKWIVDDVATPTITAFPNTQAWLIDAVRKPLQVEHFRNHFPQRIKHLHLFAEDKVLESRYLSRLNSTTEEYLIASQHPNEISAKSLKDIADYVIDTSEHTVYEIAALINEAFRG